MDAHTPRLAIIEDNDDLREELLFFLRHNGYAAWGADSAETFWKQLHRKPVDMVLIDLGLPGEDGFGVVEYLNELQGYGIVIITANGGQRQKLRALNLGADLFMVKPLNFSELHRALENLAQRLAQEAAPESRQERHGDGSEGWRLDAAAGRLNGPGESHLDLSQQETALLKILLRGTHQVFNKAALHDLMFTHAPHPDTHRIDVILSRLRRKARERGIDLPIRSIFGKGVVFTGTVRDG
ncbi:response regulator transcription factor [Alloalcanivorax gelatiniphagus]|uniref:Response regulator transcription factor n=1 Tax=Alloalcanivorax gelatiniphagus TaxID=1194167 RepID=A0ABY2XM64_9GAMM|nr:response regulator transcription factor [Alloalcanivorax gelatiniphagus]TMW13366.1 response regulator transcription factor [Alloalcanivorax gelatiniphagus]|tara:strand:- start:12440 stop:13159 length:720 start_codon:yes stop_codon:yes gene_type:complete